MNPPPQQMLLEAAMDTAQSLRLLRIGAKHDLPFREAVEIINAAIDELDYAISAVLDAKEAA